MRQLSTAVESLSQRLIGELLPVSAFFKACLHMYLNLGVVRALHEARTERSLQSIVKALSRLYQGSIMRHAHIEALLRLY